jgi:hypothetical protein
MKPDTTTLTITGIIDGHKVRGDGLNEVVNGVKIAGCEVDCNTGSTITVEVTDYGFEGKYDPYLLIEPASWFTPMEECE